MNIELDASGLQELMSALEAAASEEARAEADRRIVETAAAKAKEIMVEKVPQAADHRTSGKKGNRPAHGHAAANVPTGKAKTNKDGDAQATVGWTLGDNSEYFYMKFVNWGTLKMPPRDFVEPTKTAIEPLLSQIAEEEYTKLLKESLGGFE